MPDPTLTLYDRSDGGLALEVADADPAALATPHRTNHFTVYWVRAGSGAVRADDARHGFAAPCMLIPPRTEPSASTPTRTRA